MKTQFGRILSRSLLAVMVVFQVALGGSGWALADADPSPIVTPQATPAAGGGQSDVTPTPIASVAPLTTETPLPQVSPEVTPEPALSPSPAPEPSSQPSITPVPEPSVSPAATTSPATRGASDTGPSSCTGVIPAWVFDTVSRKWEQADGQSFVCDMATGYYLSPKYYFDKRIGWYEIIPVDTPKADYLITALAPDVIHTILGDMKVGSKDYLVAQQLGLLNDGPTGILLPTAGLAASSENVNSGPQSAASTSTSNTGQGWLDLTSLVAVINTLEAESKSGNIEATANTSVDTLSSGTASVIANLVNLLASAWSWASGDLSFFMKNLFGDYQGDILLTPNAAAGNDASAVTEGNFTVNSKTSGAIVNNLDLSAGSGDVSASSNTRLGDVSTGDANVEVNIINLINAFINSGNSFFGILNIFGSLTGNILFPVGFFDGILSGGSQGQPTVALPADTDPNSALQSAASNTTDSAMDTSLSSRAENNIQTAATSGGISTAGNAQTGNIASGVAKTTHSLFNMVNSSLFGDNAVLVIVNVLGHWVGKIMNIPGSASTSALLTSNSQIADTSSGGISAHANDLESKSQIDHSVSGGIINNVKATAQTGTAAVDSNTKVGDISTGRATVATAVANIFDSIINVKHWFGVLVINVFGSWSGDVDTAKPLAVPTVATRGLAGGSGPSSGAVLAAAAVVSPSINRNYGQMPVAAAGGGAAAETVASAPSMLLAAASVGDQHALAASRAQNQDLLFMISAVMLLIAGGLAFAERRTSRHWDLYHDDK